ncbi:sel1 repeat family protein [Vibrio scophthalmi]|uniref:sel1 repeat family protein n=1 Tax=Vibrio scophthalmi TaxID=45658 RepID=UPI003872F3C3
MIKTLTRLVIISALSMSSNVFSTTLEKGKLLFNQKEYKQAKLVFSQLANKGDAHALYWLGVTQYESGLHMEAGDTFLKAAEMGSPWAMGILAGENFNSNSPCGYLGWPCDSQWEDKAIDGWEKLAAQGDGKAVYALKANRTDWWEYIPFYKYKKYREMYELTIPHSAYGLLDCSIGTCWKTIKEYRKYQRIAADNGYAPAMIGLYYNLHENGQQEEANKWIYKAILLGYEPAAKTLYFTYSQGLNEVEVDVKKAYFFNRLTGILGGDEKESYRITQRLIVDKQGQPVLDNDRQFTFEILITGEEQAELDKQVEEFAKDIKPNMFLDETSIELF